MSERIDLSRFTGVAQNEEVARQNDPRRELRPPAEKEKPDYFQRDSSWAGSSMNGGNWSGRSR